MEEKELVNVIQQTPIEIALGIDGDGTTTARKLYDFLGLKPQNYSHWVRRNITDNDFAEENIDYFHLSSKTSEQKGRGNFAKDYRLSAHFAKKLSMKGDGEKAEQAREYFARVEERMKDHAVKAHNVNADIAMLTQSVERLTSMVANLTYRADAIGRQSSEKRGTGSEWFRRNITKIHEISKVRGVPFKKIIHEMFECLTLYEYDINAYRETYIEETGRLPEYDLDIVDYFPKLEKRAQQWIDTLYKEADYYGCMCWDDGVIREKEKFKDFLYCGNYKPWKGSKR